MTTPKKYRLFTDHPHKAVISLTFALCAFCPVLAYAGAMQDAICTVVYWIWGDMGTALAMLGVCTASGAAILGKASWGMAMTVGAGIAIMFGAGHLADSLGIGNGCPY